MGTFNLDFLGKKISHSQGNWAAPTLVFASPVPSGSGGQSPGCPHPSLAPILWVGAGLGTSSAPSLRPHRLVLFAAVF